MSAAQIASNKATLSRLHDALNSGDQEFISTTIDGIFDPDVRIGTPLPIEATGAQALKQVWATLLRAYPDLHVTVEDLFGEEDRLVARNTVTGTHQGEYLGVPPTGKSVTYNEMFIVRFADGRIAETWGIVDLLSQMKQIGAIPGSNHFKEETTMTDTALLTGQDIGEAEGAMTALLERAIAPTGRSRAEYITLRLLAAQSPHGRDAELIDHLASQRQLGLAPADVVTMLDHLRADGLMTASPIELTADGRALLEELATAVGPVTRQIFTGLDPNDLAVAHRVLVELTRRARAMTSAA